MKKRLPRRLTLPVEEERAEWAVVEWAEPWAAAEWVVLALEASPPIATTSKALTKVIAFLFWWARL
jgi:hypothetical protein